MNKKIGKNYIFLRKFCKKLYNLSENMAKIDVLFTKSLTFLRFILNLPPPLAPESLEIYTHALTPTTTRSRVMQVQETTVIKEQEAKERRMTRTVPKTAPVWIGSSHNKMLGKAILCSIYICLCNRKSKLNKFMNAWT